MTNYLNIVRSHMPPYSTAQYIPQLPRLVCLCVPPISCAAISCHSERTGKSPSRVLHYQSYGKRSEPPQIMSMPPKGRLFQMPLFSSSLMHYSMCGCVWVRVAQVWMCKSGSQLPIDGGFLKAGAFLEQRGEMKRVHHPCPSLALIQPHF